MKIFWANADYLRSDGKKDTLFTYDGCMSEKEARDTISSWKENGYSLTRAWIQVYTNGLLAEVIEVKV